MFVAVVATTGYLKFSKVVTADVSTEEQEAVLAQEWQQIKNEYSLDLEKNDMIILYKDKLFSLDQAESQGLIEYNFEGRKKVGSNQFWQVKANKNEVKIIKK